jgi:hypothetical protein
MIEALALIGGTLAITLLLGVCSMKGGVGHNPPPKFPPPRPVREGW